MTNSFREDDLCVLSSCKDRKIWEFHHRKVSLRFIQLRKSWCQNMSFQMVHRNQGNIQLLAQFYSIFKANLQALYLPRTNSHGNCFYDIVSNTLNHLINSLWQVIDMMLSSYLRVNTTIELIVDIWESKAPLSFDFSIRINQASGWLVEWTFNPDNYLILRPRRVWKQMVFRIDNLS